MDVDSPARSLPLEARILSGRLSRLFCFRVISFDFTLLLLSSHYPPQDPWVILVLSHDLQNLVSLTAPPLALIHVFAVLRSDIVLRISLHVKTSLGRGCILEKPLQGEHKRNKLSPSPLSDTSMTCQAEMQLPRHPRSLLLARPRVSSPRPMCEMPWALLKIGMARDGLVAFNAKSRPKLQKNPKGPDTEKPQT